MVLSWRNLLPMVTAFIAFILSLLCLFAGTKTNFLTGTDILTLYTPIGNDTGIHDFYSIYVMSYCAGFLGDNGLGMNLTGCSGHDVLFSFNSSQVLQHESGNDTSLSDMGWPSAISDDFKTFSITNQAMGVFYCIGAGIAGFVILIRFGLLVTRRSRKPILELSPLLVGFLSLSIASIIATVTAFQFVDLINLHGRDSNVTAKYGKQFLGMTWAAVGLLLLGSISSLISMVVDHHRPGPRSSGYIPPIGHDDEQSQAGEETHGHKEKVMEDSESARTKVSKHEGHQA